MIAAPGEISQRLIHIDGVPIVRSTGRPLETEALLSIPPNERGAWIDLARSLRGQFAIVAIEAGSAIAITDLTGCYPVFRLTTPKAQDWKLATSLAELEGSSTCTIRRTALFQYVAFGGMDLNGETIYTDIDRAPAGSVTFYSAGRAESREYADWQGMTHAAEADPEAAEARLVANIHAYTEANMARAGESEPLGILLSGGTDSTLLAALLRERWKSRLRCFTQDFRFRRYSEFPQARENAATLGITTEPVVLARAAHFDAVLALNSRRQDQPCLTMQAFNLWSLLHAKAPAATRAQAGQCRAFLLGEHADSLFLGFGHFFHGFPSDSAAYAAAAQAMTPGEKIAWISPRVELSDLDAELLVELDIQKNEYLEWLGDTVSARAARLAPFAGAHFTTVQQLNGQIDGGQSWQRIVLPVTRSLEGVRVLTPFFDPAMIELALSLPVSLKYRDGKTKYLLRSVLHKHIGRELRKQPAAASPVAIWRMPFSFRERAAVSPTLRPYYDRLARRNLKSLGRLVNHYIKVAALGIWMNGRGL